MSARIAVNVFAALGVALVINRSKDGPKFVFHYPPHIVPVEDRRREEHDDADDQAKPLGVPLQGVGVEAVAIAVADAIQIPEDAAGGSLLRWVSVDSRRSGFPVDVQRAMDSSQASPSTNG